MSISPEDHVKIEELRASVKEYASRPDSKKINPLFR